MVLAPSVTWTVAVFWARAKAGTSAKASDAANMTMYVYVFGVCEG